MSQPPAESHSRRRLVVIGTNYHFDGALPLYLDPNSEFAAMISQAYAERSPDGAEHFGEIAGKFMTLVTTEPTLSVDDLKTIVAPTLVMAGDDDMIKLSHTAALFEALPHAQLAIVPGTSAALAVIAD